MTQELAENPWASHGNAVEDYLEAVSNLPAEDQIEGVSDLMNGFVVGLLQRIRDEQADAVKTAAAKARLETHLELGEWYEELDLVPNLEQFGLDLIERFLSRELNTDTLDLTPLQRRAIFEIVSSLAEEAIEMPSFPPLES